MSNSSTECRCCGTAGTGNFCHECGARLSGEPFVTLDELRIPKAWIQSREAELGQLDYDDPRAVSLQNELDAVEQYGYHVKELVSARNGGEWFIMHHAADRIELESLLSGLPESIPGLAIVKKRVWAYVSDLEQLAKTSKISRSQHDHLDQFYRAQDAGSLARATTAFLKLRGEVTAHGPADGIPPIEEIEAQLLRLKEADQANKKTAEYAKLGEKAEKLAFMEEWKKAAKAAKEALFWLSKHPHPNHKQESANMHALLERCKMAE